MPTFPLLTHPASDSIVAWRDGVAVSVAQFLHDVARLCVLLPAGGHMLNACADRYRFTVGLAAAVTAGKVSLLPPTTTPETIRQLLLFAPDAFCLTDAADCPIGLPQVRYPDDAPAPAAIPATLALPVPQIDGGQLIACVFTSGSTGIPVPHRKTWGALVRNVQAEAQLCGLNDGRAHAVIGTVPPQHMYGFESTVLVALQSANALVSGHSFFPADVCHTIASVPRPRTLVTTPVHLRAIVESDIALPALDMQVCATAPLSAALAEQAESCFKAPLLEIYGSTETGQIALRHPVRAQSWTLFPGVRLTFEDGACLAGGGHVEIPARMQDVIEPLDEQHFLLHGRTADLVNIAGKRNSLMHLNLQLNTIPGVADGAFFMPDETAEEAARGVTRLTAFVVAPRLSAADVMAALREKIDPVFLPRPLLLVDSLPRNSTGKLPREALKRLLVGSPRSGQRSGQAPLPIAPDHPAFAGHFPGDPIVPGVVLLDEALHAIGRSIKADLSRCRINAVKFLSPARPGQPVSVHYELPAGEDAAMKIRFDIMSDARKIATGSVDLGRQSD